MIRILAIDDDKDILFTLEAIAEHAGFAMVTASNGLAGLKRLQEQKFDLILVDYHMPKMNGLEVVKQIRSKDPETPILILTVEESLEMAEKFAAVGATDFATKPIRMADLISRVKLILKLVQGTTSGEKVVYFKAEDLQKGLAPQTLQIILDYLHDTKIPKTLNQISAETGLSYQTTHRYVDYLFKMNYVNVERNYGKVGRPIQKYYLRLEQQSQPR